jgi:hypothetical protein
MGADLYINTEAFSALNDACQQMTDGNISVEELSKLTLEFHNTADYFRDPYNGLCMLNTVDISWWDDVIPMLDSDSYLSGEALGALHKRMEASVQILPTLQMLQDNHVMVSEEQTVKFWQDYLLDKREKFDEFLRRAIDNDLKIFCSL